MGKHQTKIKQIQNYINMLGRYFTI